MRLSPNGKKTAEIARNLKKNDLDKLISFTFDPLAWQEYLSFSRIDRVF
jgi:hypothetical protein